MKAAIALGVNHTIHNFMRALAVEINNKYEVGLLATSAPPHISLKLPFQITNLSILEQYFNELAASTPPFEITLTHLELKIATTNNQERAILWLAVQENKTLRDLHNKINQELTTRFENTQTDFDGSSYLFHATVSSDRQPVELYKKIYAAYKDVPANFTYQAKEILLFYKENDNLDIRDFITYKILPLGG